MLLTVIMPAYNEANSIARIIRRVHGVSLPKEIIVVDDGSTDGTPHVLGDLQGDGIAMTVIRHRVNRGKGAAVRTGLTRACGDVIIVQDADLEYDPADYAKLIAPIARGEAKVVYGSRALGRCKHSSLTFYLGGKLLTLVTNMLYGCWLTDEPTCYKVFASDVLRQIQLDSEGFEFCPEITAKVLRAGHRIVEMPISYQPRSIAEGKKIRFRDGLQALWTLFRLRFLPASRFLQSRS